MFLSNAIGGGRWRFMRGMRCTLMTAAASHCSTCVCFNTVGVIQVSSCPVVPKCHADGVEFVGFVA